MINIVLVSIGIFFMVLSVFMVVRLISSIEDPSLKKKWWFLFFLIGFFLIGYGFYLYALISEKVVFFMEELLVSAIFCFGALFVLVVLLITINLVKTLNEDRKQLNNKNKELSSLTENLQSNNTKLEETKNALDSKNSELNSLLEEFYTLRVSMLGAKNTKKVKKENILIKKKFDKAKKP
jgi:uncharacterized membrane protein